MDTKDSTKKPRHSVQQIGTRYAIFDETAWTYTLCQPGTSKVQAEQQCGERNGTGRGRKKSETSTSLHRRFCEKGITPEEIDPIDDNYYVSLDEYRPTESVSRQAQHLIDTYRNWLPRMLRVWADEVALQCGYGGARRRSWHTFLVMKALESDVCDFACTPGVIDGLHFEVWPTRVSDWQGDIFIERRQVLAAHYLSSDAAHIKAGYFGVSERPYQRQVEAAHQWLARRWVTTTALLRSRSSAPAPSAATPPSQLVIDCLTAGISTIWK
jgi:hypothetical protein